MCGIFVYLGHKYSVEKLRPHFDKIRHRGPEFSKIISICPGVIFGFHRLAIIDSSESGHQPIFHPDDPAQVIVTNGEIYNYKTLKDIYDYHPRSGSDSDVMLHLYHHFGVEAMVRELDGVYAFVIRDHDKIIAGNDIIGVRPLFVAYLPEGELAFCSEEKSLFGLNAIRIERFKPGTFIVHNIGQPVSAEEGLSYNPFFDWYHGPDRIDVAPLKFADEKTVCSTIEEYLIQSVKKRLISDRPIGCLLSGGLDSSLIASIVSRYYSGAKATTYHSTQCLFNKRKRLDHNGHIESSPTDLKMANGDIQQESAENQGRRMSYSPTHKHEIDKFHKSYDNDDADDHDVTSPNGNIFNVNSQTQHVCNCAKQPHLSTLHTFSVGMRSEQGTSYSPDLEYAQMVADKLGTKHHRIEFTFDEAFKSIREVIWALGSWDCTTVRASIGQFIMAKYIRDRTDVKVLMSGEGAEETFGSYSYLKRAPSPNEFSEEVIDLCQNLYQFDALRSDRTLAYFGLEMREPFLDKKLFPYVLFRIPAKMKMHGVNDRMEKHILRKAFEKGDYLPREVLWRKKEAFSDGVNYEFRDKLIAKINTLISDSEFEEKVPKLAPPRPLTKEAYYYRKIYDELFPNHPPLVTKNWMPRLDWFPENERIKLVDPSARVLSTYDIEPKQIQKLVSGTTLCDS